MQEHLNFVASELHIPFNTLFRSSSSDDAKETARASIARRFDNVEGVLADVYLFAVSRWSKGVGIDLSR